jgi:hypothetical protein
MVGNASLNQELRAGKNRGATLCGLARHTRIPNKVA